MKQQALTAIALIGLGGVLSAPSFSADSQVAELSKKDQDFIEEALSSGSLALSDNRFKRKKHEPLFYNFVE